MPAQTIIQIRRDLAANWLLMNPILAPGEVGIELDTNKFKIGIDGLSTWDLIPYYSDAITIAQSQVDGLTTDLLGKLDLSGGIMTGSLTLDGNPTQALHAVTKQYVDNVEAGIITRPQVRAATTENLDATYDNGTLGVGATLTSTTNGAFPLVDNVALTTVNGARGILVKNQTSSLQNGRYNLTTQGDSGTPWVLTRCGLCDEADEIPGSYVFVTDGDINEGTGWVQNVSDPATFVVGTDSISAFQFTGGGGSVTAGTNISVSGNEVSVIDNPSFSDVVTTNGGILNAQAAKALITSGYNSILGGPMQDSRLIMSATSTANTPLTGTCTISIASPAVITRTSHGHANGSFVYFTTTGALPTGLAIDTGYYVINAATNTFQVSATLGGTAINTSGTQSGTHTVLRQTAPRRRPDGTALVVGDIWLGFV